MAEAGAIEFRGIRNGSDVQGDFTTRLDPSFQERVVAKLTAPPSNIEWLWFVLHRVRLDEITVFTDAGVRLSAGDFLRLRQRGVSPEYLAEVRRARDFSIDEVARFKSFGVPAQFPSELKSAGYEFRADEILRLRQYNVSAMEAGAWKSAGFNFDVNDLVKLRNYGVRSDLGKAARTALGSVTADELVRLRNYGVTEQYLSEIQQTGQKFSADDFVHLRNHGVSSAYISEWSKAGFQFTAQEITKLRNGGVPASYASALNIPNRKPLSSDTIIKFHQRGLSADEIRQLRE